MQRKWQTSNATTIMSISNDETFKSTVEEWNFSRYSGNRYEVRWQMRLLQSSLLKAKVIKIGPHLPVIVTRKVIHFYGLQNCKFCREWAVVIKHAVSTSSSTRVCM